MLAAVRALRKENVAEITVAVPVAAAAVLTNFCRKSIRLSVPLRQSRSKPSASGTKIFRRRPMKRFGSLSSEPHDNASHPVRNGPDSCAVSSRHPRRN